MRGGEAVGSIHPVVRSAGGTVLPVLCGRGVAAAVLGCRMLASPHRASLWIHSTVDHRCSMDTVCL